MENSPPRVLDLSDSIVITSIARDRNPDDFHSRLCRWLVETGFPHQNQSTYQLLAMLDDDRLLALGRLVSESLQLKKK